MKFIKKNINKIFALTLATLMLTPIIGVASTTVTIDINKIDRMMLDRSDVIKKIKNDAWATQQKYDELNSSISDIYSSIKNIENKIATLDPIKDADQIATLRSQVASLNSQAGSMLSSQSQLKLASDTSEATLNQQVSQQILQAKQLFVTCLLDESSYETASLLYEQKQKDIATAEEKLKRGYISKNAYDTLIISLNDMNSSLNTTASQKEANMNSLKNLLGIDKNTEVILEAVKVTEFDFRRIESLNFENDLDYVMRDSSSIRAAQIAYDAKKNSSAYNNYESQSASYNLTNTKNNVKSAFTSQYESLQNSYQAMKVSKQKLDIQLKTYEREILNLEKGYTSQSAFNNIEINTKNMIAQVYAMENQVYIQYLSYINTRDGK